LVAFGLLCFSGWRIAQAILDPDRLSTEGKALVRRMAYGVSGVVHAGLAFFAVSVIFGLKAARSTDEQSARDWTAYILAAPFGRWLVGAVGSIIVAAGIGIAVKGWTASFERGLEVQGQVRRWAVPLGRFGSLYVSQSPLFMSNRKEIIAIGTRARLPAMYGWREFAEAGGLASYGPNLADIYGRSAEFVDKILKGANPANLPVEIPTRFELVVNLKAAKAMGLSIPDAFVLLADEVIE
jgi:putative ABC transport system substrate-binding protein